MGLERTRFPQRIGRATAALGIASSVLLLLACGAAPGDDPGCGPRPVEEGPWIPQDGSTCDRLSTYGLIALDDEGRVVPADGTMPFDLNTPLFSDYAHKTRTVWVPDGSPAELDERGNIAFPVGTVITKTFAFPEDFRDPDRNRHVVETRLLVRLEDGWSARPYVWNADRTEAFLRPTGAVVPVRWVDDAGAERSNDYLVPNVNQCIECHGNVRPETGQKVLGLIGPKARHLNGSFDYGAFFEGDGLENQLERWRRDGMLVGGPSDPADLPRVPDWDDPADGSLHARARGYLDINCGHCHNARGSASYTGLWMAWEVDDPMQWGVCQGRSTPAPIVPGHPELSRIISRTDTTDPQERMPRLGRTVVHEEGVALLRQWVTWLGTDAAIQALGLDDPRYDCF